MYGYEAKQDQLVVSFKQVILYILVKVPHRVHYEKYSPRAILASRPNLRAIFPIVNERKRYFNWFIATYTKQYFRYYNYYFPGENIAHYVRYGK